jgi:hypothetical protein
VPTGVDSYLCDLERPPFSPLMSQLDPIHHFIKMPFNILLSTLLF